MSDTTSPPPPETPTKTPRRKRAAPPTGISDEDMERFKTWIEDKSRYKTVGGFIPYLKKLMQDNTIEGLSTSNFHKKPRDGKKLVGFLFFFFFVLTVIHRWIFFHRLSLMPCGPNSSTTMLTLMRS